MAWLAQYVNRARWNVPWRHRPLDVEQLACPVLGWAVPRSLSDTAAALDIPVDRFDRHHAAGDVELVIATFQALRDAYLARGITWPPQAR